MVTTGGRFLFVTWPGGGNVQPFLGLGTRLVARGHAVRAIGPESNLVERQFEACDLTYQSAPTEDMAPVVLDAVARNPVDVLVVDYMQPDALCGAERTGHPYVALVHTLYRQVAVAEPSPMVLAADVPEVNALRDDLGLAPVQRVTDLLDLADRVLVVAPHELDQPVDSVADNVRYVGPVLEEVGPDAGWRPDCPDEQLVVVSLGTTPMDEAPLVQRLLDAMADLPVRVMVNLGEHLDSAAFRVPANAALSGYVRHSAVLPYARLMINHAGLGGIVAALACGVPMLCLPLGRDQPANARAVEASGAGRTVSADTPVAELRAIVADVLGRARYRDAAMHLAASFQARRGGHAAVEELEALLAGSARASRV